MVAVNMKPEDCSKYLHGGVNWQFLTALKGGPVYLIVGKLIIYIHLMIFSQCIVQRTPLQMSCLRSIFSKIKSSLTVPAVEILSVS